MQVANRFSIAIVTNILFTFDPRVLRIEGKLLDNSPVPLKVKGAHVYNLHHVDDILTFVPQSWLQHGCVLCQPVSCFGNFLYGIPSLK